MNDADSDDCHCLASKVPTRPLFTDVHIHSEATTQSNAKANSKALLSLVLQLPF